MRHNVYGKKLGRNKNERSRLFKSLIQSLFTYGTITTSEAKVKAIKGMVDKIINMAKSKNSQYLLQSYLTSKGLQDRLTKEIAPKLDNRVSGFTTTVRLGVREGDRTNLVRMSIIGSEKLKPIEKKVTSDKVQVTSNNEETKKVSSEKKSSAKLSTKAAPSTRRVKSRPSKKII